MTRISTHVLDAVLGKPAAGVALRLEKLDGSLWSLVSHGVTDADGRCLKLAGEIVAGTYRLTFESAEYFERNNRKSIYPEVSITFRCDDDAHYHLPLLLSDNSYTTYRGS